METTFKITTAADSHHFSNKFGLGFKVGLDVELQFCIGIALVALAETCAPMTDLSSTVNVFDIESDIGGQTFMSDAKTSDEYTVTWSYATSSDPALAGSESDVFVVPNLNVKYLNTTEVLWNETTCQAKTSNKITFDLDNNRDNTPAITFFSRHHIKTVKLVELRSTFVEKEKEHAKCTAECKGCERCQEIADKVTIIHEGIHGWSKALEIGSNSNSTRGNIDDWFDTNHDITKPSLIPPSLQASATKLKNNITKTEKDAVSNLSTTNRIQFSGGGEVFSMSLKQDHIEEIFNNFDTGGDWDTATNVKAYGLEEFAFGVGGATVSTRVSALDATISTSHTSSRGTDTQNSTEVSFVLGDKDPGDEFVVDTFYDARYKSIVFDTVAGRSKCPHENGTVAIEDPSIEISFSSSVVTPDEEIVFELILRNKGVGESAFVLYPDLRGNEGNLHLQLDGAPFAGNRQYDWIGADESVTTTLTVSRGPKLYQNIPITLWFRSACGDPGKMLPF